MDVFAKSFDNSSDSRRQTVNKQQEQNYITIKIKRADNKITKVKVNPKQDTVLSVKSKVFFKEQQENKNIRLIYQGKILADRELLSVYNLQEGAYIHAFITEIQRRDSDVEQTVVNDPDQKFGFDRLLQNGAYSEIEVHSIRLHFHSIMMRCGVEKTSETQESLLENEERWLNKQLPNFLSEYSKFDLDYLREIPTVLSTRNDLVLPRYHKQPQIFEKEGTILDLIKGILIGFFLTVFFFFFYIFLSTDVSKEKQLSNKKKNGVFIGAFCNFAVFFIIFLCLN